MDWKKKLQQFLEKPPLMEESMHLYTSFRIGGPAEAMVFPGNIEELKKVLYLARDYRVPVYVLGRGTNLLVKDEGIRGIVLNLTTLCSGVTFEGDRVKAGSAVLLKQLVAQSVNKGLQGLEFAAGIPGSLGGAIFMNAGAYGFNVGNLVVEVELINYDGVLAVRSREELDFSYRWSNFQKERAFILYSTLQLKPGDKNELKKKVKDIKEKRRVKQPSLPSAGSVFRNPTGCPAGYLVEKAGAKGMRVGGAMVSMLHGNFIINTGGATAADVLLLIEKVRNKVKEELDVDLQLEIEVVGGNQPE